MKKPTLPPEVAASSSSNAPASIYDSKGRYVHWDKLQFLAPPEKLSSEQWWANIKHSRRTMYKSLDILDSHGKPFVFLYSDEIMKDLHWIDQNASGMVGSNQPIINSQMKNTYLIRSLIEESINSSQLEGASTTWRVAKEMLIQNRKPHDKNEQMIHNNYNAMQLIKDLKHDHLTIKSILEIQKILTENTLEDNNHSGYFRTAKEDVNVVDYKGEILHAPPVAEKLPERMRAFINFANNTNQQVFIHPIIKSIILHFLIGYEHPFVDGNDRTARALFYWSMAKQNYWLMEYISISRIIKQAPTKYAKAYLLTETDENDLTYFIEYHLKVIKQAIEDLYVYIDHKMHEIETAEVLFKNTKDLNDKLNYRQLAIIKHAMKHPNYIYTITEHQNSHGIAYDTARLDLMQLSDSFNFLSKESKGKGYIFKSPPNLVDLIRQKSSVR